jgi:Domain of unknown function (DUF4149)
MKAILLYVGTINAAIWFGASLFFALGILPGVFSHEMRDLFRNSGFTYYSGAVALSLFRRFFALQYLCGSIALVHLVVDHYLGSRVTGKLHAWLLVALFLCGLTGGLWLQPTMEKMRQDMYFSPSLSLREQARQSFGLWHGMSQGVNMLILAGLLLHLVRCIKIVQNTGARAIFQIPH